MTKKREKSAQTSQEERVSEPKTVIQTAVSVRSAIEETPKQPKPNRKPRGDVNPILDERRKYPRYRRRFVIFYTAGKASGSGYTCEIAEGGLFVETTECFDIGTQVDIEIYLDLGDNIVPIRTQAEVVHWGSSQPGVKKGMAFRFVGVSEPARKALREAIIGLEQLPDSEPARRVRTLEEQLHAVSAIGEALATSMGLDALFERVVPNVTRLMRADRSTLFLCDSETDEIWSSIAEGETSREIRLKLGQGIAGWVAKHHKPLNIPDAYQDPRFNQEVDVRTGYHTRSVAATPILDRQGELMGVLQVLNHQEGAFGDKEMRLLATIATQTAYAIENAGQAQEIMDQNQRLQQSVQELREMQSQLIQAEKMTALGQLAAGVAHELNQPLNNIKLIMQSRLRDIEKDGYEISELISDSKEVVDLVDRMAEIIDHMRVFTRKTEGEVVVNVDVNVSITNALGLLQQQLRDNDIQLEKKLCSDLPAILGHPNNLEQVFLNLLTNARDAVLDKMQSDGHHGKIGIRSFILNDSELCVDVEDNGGGMPRDIRNKLFDPFFTTKAVGKGTGLGLSISQRIVGEYGGRIELEVREGTGTCFHIILPVARKHGAGLTPDI